MEPQDKEPLGQDGAKTVETPAPSVADSGVASSVTPEVVQTTEGTPRHEIQPLPSSLTDQAPQTTLGFAGGFQPPTLKEEVSLPESLDASSIASSSATPIPANHQQNRPDDTDFVQHPVQHAQLAEEQELEPEDDDDSAIGSDTQSLTTTLSESIYNYRREHGRTYHAYKDGKYIFPNDEREADRLDLQHHLFRITFGNRLYFAPLKDVKRAIDIGTGTGIWAVDFADAHPEAEVIGIDLSPGQPTLVPPNLKFIIDDAEDLWIYDQTFDYIHARLMAGCFADWQNFFRQAYQNLEPGGWLELQDYGLPVKSADNTHLGTDLLRWGELLCHAARNLGRPMGSDVSEKYEEWMRDAGFVDIQQRMFMWPSNNWPRDPYMKELGRWNQVNILDGLEGFCLALLTRGLGWTKQEVDVFVARVGRDLKDRRIHAYFPMPVTFGRKPYPGESVH
ncbi:hypothetical protein LTR78_004088 [Recurvomyces mirabilis]|uniref:S-adenosyl-L-methionine-dependent methyltransferase n=1 Tax=Recurvomyces mirabilis TaxID=574656 RepID=A0AAE1C2P3_9PEZI|nr:hypothetical protein LTR78_004088 [Recurvomyces mirabilis]KAK5153739.1 hypothetical protein LTS14_007433 [Recurvomyces mirabilis]